MKLSGYQFEDITEPQQEELVAPDVIGQMEVREALVHALSKHFTPRDAEIICLYFGVNDKEEQLTQSELAERYNIDQSSVQRIIAKVASTPALAAEMRELL